MQQFDRFARSTPAGRRPEGDMARVEFVSCIIPTAGKQLLDMSIVGLLWSQA